MEVRISGLLLKLWGPWLDHHCLSLSLWPQYDQFYFADMSCTMMSYLLAGPKPQGQAALDGNT